MLMQQCSHALRKKIVECLSARMCVRRWYLGQEGRKTRTLCITKLEDLSNNYGECER